MIKDVILPEVSENVDSGDVVQVLVKIGDIIEKDQSLIELETDKAAVEIPSTEKGKVTEVLVKVGDSIKIGAPIIKIDTDNESSPDAEIKSPEIRTEDNSKESVKDKSEDQVIYKKSDKTDNQENEDKKPLQAGTNIEHTTDSRNIGNEKINNLAAPASPSVRLLARELGIEINNVSGSGPGGRISADDVKKFAKAILQGNTKVKDTEIKALPDFSKWGHIDIEEMSKVRKITAAAMAYAWSTIPQVTQYDKADITNLELFRNKNEKLAEKNNGKLTVTSILVKIKLCFDKIS
jgi:pyruvate dehydrogenase E2 component (dihydrolipoamide acetyltransferase)